MPATGAPGSGSSLAHGDQQRPVEDGETADRTAEIGAVGAVLVGAHRLLECAFLLALGAEQIQHQLILDIR